AAAPGGRARADAARGPAALRRPDAPAAARAGLPYRRLVSAARLGRMPREPLIDGHGRRISDVRVSVTDRCNFRCQYCMPAEGLPWLERDDVLSFEEIVPLAAA